MSYSIYIGEAIIDSWHDEDENENTLRLAVEKTEHPDAPFWEHPEDVSGKTNGRHPGYGQFAKFCEIAGIYDLFFDEEQGLMRKHPGTFLIRQKDAEALTRAKERWIAENPGTTAGWNDGDDMILARLIWFEWWFSHALRTCKKPAIQNS